MTNHYEAELEKQNSELQQRLGEAESELAKFKTPLTPKDISLVREQCDGNHSTQIEILALMLLKKDCGVVNNADTDEPYIKYEIRELKNLGPNVIMHYYETEINITISLLKEKEEKYKFLTFLNKFTKTKVTEYINIVYENRLVLGGTSTLRIDSPSFIELVKRNIHYYHAKKIKQIHDDHMQSIDKAMVTLKNVDDINFA